MVYFPGQPGKAGFRKDKLYCILMKQEIMGWAMASAGTYANQSHLASDR